MGFTACIMFHSSFHHATAVSAVYVSWLVTFFMNHSIQQLQSVQSMCFTASIMFHSSFHHTTAVSAVYVFNGS